MGKDANSSRRCRRTRGPDASRGSQGPTLPMHAGQCTSQAACQAAAIRRKEGGQ